MPTALARTGPGHGGPDFLDPDREERDGQTHGSHEDEKGSPP